MLKENPEELPRIKMHQLDKQFFGSDKITVCKKWVVFTIDNVDAKNLKKLLGKKYSNVQFRNQSDVLYIRKQFTSKVTLKEGDLFNNTKAVRITESLCDQKAFDYIISVLADIADYYKSKENALIDSLSKFVNLSIIETEHIKDLDK